MDRLEREGHDVAVMSRSGTIAADVTRPETLTGTCDGRDVVVSLVGASLLPVPQIPEQTFEAVDRDGNLNLLTNPTHEADLADVIADHLVDGPATVECGGPEVLSRAEINQRLGARVSIPMPAALVRWSSSLQRPVSKRLADITVFLEHVLTHDGIAPARGTRRL